LKAAIIGSGAVSDYQLIAREIHKCDYIICADGGITHLIKMNISPDVVIGDFDSCDFNSVKDTPAIANAQIISCNPEKDDTDMQLCIDHALNIGFDNIVLFAALGGRVDHELSNIFHLEYIKSHGADGMIFSEYNRIYITDSALTIQREPEFKMSIIPLTERAEGVTLKGVYYPLHKATILRGSSLGISNEITASAAEISVDSGKLLVFHSKDNRLS